MAEQKHRSDPRILNRRTLERHHKRLLPFLRPGISVLDAGCGPGAITRGIAEAVGPEGRVVGVDKDPDQIAAARQENAGVGNLVFEVADATALPFDRRFDVVSAARTLQWIANPRLAIQHLCKALKPGGYVVVLDYNHTEHTWQPEVPAEFQLFYQSFLTWRERNGWDNRIADRLANMFSDCGLEHVQVWKDDEMMERGAVDFAENSLLWACVVETLGPRIIEEGVLGQSAIDAAGRTYRTYAEEKLQRHVMSIRTVAGRRPERA